MIFLEFACFPDGDEGVNLKPDTFRVPFAVLPALEFTCKNFINSMPCHVGVFSAHPLLKPCEISKLFRKSIAIDFVCDEASGTMEDTRYKRGTHAGLSVTGQPITRWDPRQAHSNAGLQTGIRGQKTGTRVRCEGFQDNLEVRHLHSG